MEALVFEEWYRANAGRLVAALAVAVGDVEVASDAVADACAKAFARWGRVSRTDNPSGWVYVVARREAARRQRRDGRDRQVVEPLRSIEDPLPSPELWAAVRGLPERMRAAVALRYLGGFSEEEVAEALSITRGGASSLLHKARASLREALTEGAGT
jgi:RNA polymerase sigma-70 factor (ECF subfamily)